MTAAATTMARHEATLRSYASVDVRIEKDARAWSDYVAGHADATGYHEWPWRVVFERAFGCEPIYLAAYENNRVVGILPTVFVDSWLFGRSLISLPYLNYGGVLAEDAATERLLFDRAVDIARQRRCRHVELHHVEQRFVDRPSKRHKVTMLLALHEPAALWNAIDRKIRNQVRKGQKSDLIYTSGGRDHLDMFYAVFARNMRDLGTPVYSRRFFAEILDAFPDRTRIHVVLHQGAPAAAGLTFATRGTVEIPWASSVRDFNHLCVNPFLYWNVLEWAATNGAATFDFGRSTPNEGTYRFKEQWGARPVSLCWEYGLIDPGELPNTSAGNPKFRVAVAVWKKLPLSIATRVGPLIVKAIP